MKFLPRLSLAAPLFLLSGCGLVAAAIILPIRIIVGTLALTAWILVGAEGSDAQQELYAGGVRLDRHVLEVELAEDLTYEATVVVERTVTDTAGLDRAHRASLSFDPRTQELELVRARVHQPDGEQLDVKLEDVFTRPSAAAQSTPGFVSKLTKTVVFPQLSVGSQTAVTWRFKEKAQSVLGFNYVWRPSFAIPVTDARIRISYPSSLPLRCESTGTFEVSRTAEGNRRVVEATLRNYAAQKPEWAMVDPRGVCPVVVFSTVDSWESIGAQFHAAVMDKVEDTAAIRAKAAEIVGEKVGLDAARAIHRWVCRNIQYIAVYLGQMDGWVPQPASEVLANSYGDCKGQFVLLASLLKARGIVAEPVLVDLGRVFHPYPLCTPLQFDHCMAFLPEFDVYSNPTDPYRDLGELDVALSNKFVVIGSEKGRVGHTPAGKPGDNKYSVRHTAELAADGRMSGESQIHVSGRPSARLRRDLSATADRGDAVDGMLMGTPEGGVGELESTDPSDLDVPFELKGAWKSELPLEMEPTLYFHVPVGIDLVTPARVREFLFLGKRKYPVVISALDVEWNYEIRLPAGYAFTKYPKDRSIENDEARFQSRYELRDGALHIHRTLILKRDVFSPDQYDALRKVLMVLGADIEAVLIATRGS